MDFKQIEKQVMDFYRFHRFEEFDWDGMAGAERFPDCSDPYIASFGTKCDARENNPWTDQYIAADLIIDGAGLCLTCWEDPEDDYNYQEYHLETESYEESIRILFSYKFIDLVTIKRSWNHSF